MSTGNPSSPRTGMASEPAATTAGGLGDARMSWFVARSKNKLVLWGVLRSERHGAFHAERQRGTAWSDRGASPEQRCECGSATPNDRTSTRPSTGPLLNRRHSQLIATFVVGVASVAAGPFGGELMAFALRLQALPQVLIGHRLSGSVTPSRFESNRPSIRSALGPRTCCRNQRVGRFVEAQPFGGRL